MNEPYIKTMKITRTKAELIESFKNQLHSLADLSELFDSGKEHIFQDIATKIRVIFHNSNSSKSLVKQLKLEHIPMNCSALKYSQSNMVSHLGLVGFAIGTSTAKYRAPLDDIPVLKKHVTQENWWNSNKVIVDSRKIAFTRRQLVLEVANTDGGAHVDDSIKEDYYNLSRLNSCSWQRVGPGGPEDFESPVPASIRQIAWEILGSFQAIDIASESRLYH